MKVIAINGSPHAGGTVSQGLKVLTGQLEHEGIEVELIQVGNQVIRGCMACGKCWTLGKCVFDDDLVNPCADKVNQADGLVLGSPVYYGGVAGTFKSFLDRLFFRGLDMKYKAAAVVVALRRTGGISAFHQLNNYLNLAQAFLTPTQYWAVIHGNSPAEAEQDAEGMQIMRSQGRNMAWLLKALAQAKQNIPLPEAEGRIGTNFIR